MRVNIDTIELIKEKKLLLSPEMFQQFIARNVRRLKVNVQEYTRKAEDIENAYPDYFNTPKFEKMDWNHYQDCIKCDLQKLKLFEKELL